MCADNSWKHTRRTNVYLCPQHVWHVSCYWQDLGQTWRPSQEEEGSLVTLIYFKQSVLNKVNIFALCICCSRVRWKSEHYCYILTSTRSSCSEVWFINYCRRCVHKVSRILVSVKVRLGYWRLQFGFDNESKSRYDSANWIRGLSVSLLVSLIRFS